MFVFRYLDSAKRTQESVENDFHAYDVNKGEWRRVSRNVAASGGPRLIFDHQVSKSDPYISNKY